MILLDHEIVRFFGGDGCHHRLEIPVSGDTAVDFAEFLVARIDDDS